MDLITEITDAEDTSTQVRASQCLNASYWGSVELNHSKLNTFNGVTFASEKLLKAIDTPSCTIVRSLTSSGSSKNTKGAVSVTGIGPTGRVSHGGVLAYIPVLTARFPVVNRIITPTERRVGTRMGVVFVTPMQLQAVKGTSLESSSSGNVVQVGYGEVPYNNGNTRFMVNVSDNVLHEADSVQYLSQIFTTFCRMTKDGLPFSVLDAVARPVYITFLVFYENNGKYYNFYDKISGWSMIPAMISALTMSPNNFPVTGVLSVNTAGNLSIDQETATPLLTAPATAMTQFVKDLPIKVWLGYQQFRQPLVICSVMPPQTVIDTLNRSSLAEKGDAYELDLMQFKASGIVAQKNPGQPGCIVVNSINSLVATQLSFMKTSIENTSESIKLRKSVMAEASRFRASEEDSVRNLPALFIRRLRGKDPNTNWDTFGANLTAMFNKLADLGTKPMSEELLQAVKTLYAQGWILCADSAKKGIYNQMLIYCFGPRFFPQETERSKNTWRKELYISSLIDGRNQGFINSRTGCHICMFMIPENMPRSDESAASFLRLEGSVNTPAGHGVVDFGIFNPPNKKVKSGGSSFGTIAYDD